MKPALERRLADAGDLGRLTRGESLDIAKYDRRAARHREVADCHPQRLAQLLALGLAGRFVPRRGRNVGGLLIHGHVRAAPRSSLERAVGLVDCDPVEPREDHRATLEAADAAPRAQERLLQDIFGFATVAEEPQGDRVQAVRIYVGKRFEGTHVAGLGPTDQLVLGNIDGSGGRAAHGSSDSPASVSARAASARTRSKMPDVARGSACSEEPPRSRRRARRARIPRLQSGHSAAWSSRRLRLRQLMSPSR